MGWSGICRFFYLGVTILLSLTVFMNMVSSVMPSTSDAVPLIGRRAGLLADPVLSHLL